MHWINGVLRYMRKCDSFVWDYYGLVHILGILFSENMLKNGGSKAAEIRVSRAARDTLFTTFEFIRENSELMAIVPAKNRREANPLPTPNASIPPGKSSVSTEVRTAHSQTNAARTHGHARLRGGEGSTTAEIGAGLASGRPYHPHRLWLPSHWFDWSVFYVRDGDGE